MCIIIIVCLVKQYHVLDKTVGNQRASSGYMDMAGRLTKTKTVFTYTAVKLFQAITLERWNVYPRHSYESN